MATEPHDALKELSPELRRRAAGAERVAALTGAGVSAASGIPTFRGAGGYWRGRDPASLASPHGFASDPELVWTWYGERRELIDRAAPNAAHRALAQLERHLGTERFTLITQNVDGLHRRAGSRSPIELHGNLTRAKCWRECGRTWEWRLPLAEVPPRCACGELARPDVVWFGEMLDAGVIAAASRAAAAADVLLVVGTSAVVEPAASLPLVARAQGGMVIEINPELTPLTPSADLHLHGAADRVLPPLVAAIWQVVAGE